MKNIFKIPICLIFIIWIVYVINTIVPGIDLNQYGIVPRTLDGLKGILFAPFLHANLHHIMANTVPLFLLSYLVLVATHRKLLKVLFGVTIIGGFLTWCIARGATVHIGASGVIYGLASFLVFLGLYRRDFRSIIIAILVVILYGGLVWGVLPRNSYVSWEGHLCGAISGFIMAKWIGAQKRRALFKGRK